MADLPTYRDLFRVARDEVMAGNANLTRSIVERQGTDANALVNGMAAVGDETIGQLAKVEASLFLDSAEGLALDRLVFDRYTLTRKPASAAQTSVNFSCPLPSPGPFPIPAGSRLKTSDGREWVTVVSGTFLGGATSLTGIAVRSSKAGLDQQVSIGAISSITDMPASAAPGLTVTNALASAGADDEESDEDLRNRARLFFTTARRATIAAIEQAALAVPGVRRATAFEAVDSGGRPARFVELVIADAYTDVLADLTPTPAAYAAQSQVLALTVSQGLDDARAAGIFVQPIIASVILQDVQIRLVYLAGVNAAAVALLARVAVVNYTNSLRPGETFVQADASAAIGVVPGLLLTGNEVSVPSGNVVPGPLQVIRTTLALVTANPN